MSRRLFDRQRKSFDSLVDSGVYSTDFDHAPAAKEFVASVLERILPRVDSDSRSLRLLDCGCGTGAWLAFLHANLVQAGMTVERLCGFDLSVRMVEVAHDRLAGLTRPADIRTGNILEAGSYEFTELDEGFDLIFAYDVVQQLPRGQQIDACRKIAGALAPGGVALIFDNDADTAFGRRMARRKFFTRYLGLPLVPRYYCNASYPPLRRYCDTLGKAAELSAEIVVRHDGIKRALVVQRCSNKAPAADRHKVSDL